MLTPLHFVRQACRPRRSVLAVWMLAESVIVAAAALMPAVAGLLLATRGAVWAVGTAFAAACLLAFKGLVRQRLAHEGRTAWFAHIARTTASRSALGTASEGADRIEAKLFDSAYQSSRLLSDLVPTIAGNAVAFLVVLPVLFWLTTWKLVLIATPALLVLGGSFYLLRRVSSRRTRVANDAAMDMIDEAASLLRGHHDLAATARLNGQAETVVDRARRYSEALRASERANAIGGRIPMMAALSLAVLTGWIWLADRPELLTGTVARFLVVGSVFPMIAAATRASGEVHRSLREIAPLVELLDLPAAPTTRPGARKLDPTQAIRFHNLSFRYDATDQSDRPALDDVSFSWRRGEFLALTGPNGSGKSTLVRLLLRMADPAEGAIYVGSADLREGDLDAWRSSIAYLPQRPFLPGAHSLRAAVATFGPDVPEDALIEALDDTGLLPKLQRFHPSDPLAAKISSLSAGERQRFALARVLAIPSEVIILDEPDANLDRKGLEVLISTLPDLSNKRRILLVAHDHRLLACADRVVELGSTRGSPGASATSH